MKSVAASELPPIEAQGTTRENDRKQLQHKIRGNHTIM